MVRNINGHAILPDTTVYVHKSTCTALLFKPALMATPVTMSDFHLDGPGSTPGRVRSDEFFFASYICWPTWEKAVQSVVSICIYAVTNNNIFHSPRVRWPVFIKFLPFAV